MKKTVRMLALVMALATVLCLFAACGTTLSGTYASEEEFGSNLTMEFKGKKVTFMFKVLGQELPEFEGTYTIEDDEITFEFDEDDIDNDIVRAMVEELTDSVDFEKGKDYIKIAGVKYEKE